VSLKDTVRGALLSKLLKELIAEADQTGRAEALAALLAARDALGVKSVDIELPDGTRVGTATLTQPKAGVCIDDAAFLKWVAAERPTEIVTAVRESFRRVVVGRLKIVGEDVVDKTTGEVMPWASVRPAADTPTSFSVRYAEGGREAIEQAWREGRFNPLDHLTAPALSAGGEER
jgi:hypothetical protein